MAPHTVVPAQPVPDPDLGAGTQERCGAGGAGRAVTDIPHFPVPASVSYPNLHEPEEAKRRDENRRILADLDLFSHIFNKMVRI